MIAQIGSISSNILKLQKFINSYLKSKDKELVQDGTMSYELNKSLNSVLGSLMVSHPRNKFSEQFLTATMKLLELPLHIRNFHLTYSEENSNDGFITDTIFIGELPTFAYRHSPYISAFHFFIDRDGSIKTIKDRHTDLHLSDFTPVDSLISYTGKRSITIALGGLGWVTSPQEGLYHNEVFDLHFTANPDKTGIQITKQDVEVPEAQSKALIQLVKDLTAYMNVFYTDYTFSHIIARDQELVTELSLIKEL